jgi:hypothetical protein
LFFNQIKCRNLTIDAVNKMLLVCFLRINSPKLNIFSGIFHKDSPNTCGAF